MVSTTTIERVDVSLRVSRYCGNTVDLKDSGNVDVVVGHSEIGVGRFGRVDGDIILSSRRHKLETELEQNLLEDASRNQKFVIY